MSCDISLLADEVIETAGQRPLVIVESERPRASSSTHLCMIFYRDSHCYFRCVWCGLLSSENIEILRDRVKLQNDIFQGYFGERNCKHLFIWGKKDVYIAKRVFFGKGLIVVRKDWSNLYGCYRSRVVAETNSIRVRKWGTNVVVQANEIESVKVWLSAFETHTGISLNLKDGRMLCLCRKRLYFIAEYLFDPVLPDWMYTMSEVGLFTACGTAIANVLNIPFITENIFINKQ